MADNLQDNQNFTSTDSLFNYLKNRDTLAVEDLHQERVNEQINQANSGQPSIFNSLFRSVGIGLTDFVNETDKTFGISDSLKNVFGLDLQLGEDTFLYDAEKDLNLTPRNTFEHLVSTFTQFLVPFSFALKGVSGLTKAAKVFKKSPKLKAAVDGIIAGAPVDAAVFNPNDPNAANALLGLKVISENPQASAFIKEYLATNPNDSEALNRARNAMIGALGGIIGEGIVAAIGKTYKFTKGTTKELQGLGDESTQTLSDAIVAAKEGPDKLRDDYIKKLIDTLPDEEFSKAVKTPVTGKVDIETPIEGKVDAPEVEPKNALEFLTQLKDEERKTVLDAVMRIGDGENVEFTLKQITETGEDKKGLVLGLARFVNKIEAPEDVTNLIKYLSKELEPQLARATKEVSPDADTALTATLFGKTFKQYSDDLATKVDNVNEAIPYNVSSRAVAALLASKTMRALNTYLADTTEANLGAVLDATSMTKVVIEGGINLGTAAARNLASRKQIADLEELTGYEDLLRIQLMNKVFYPTKEVAIAKAKQLKLLDKDIDLHINNLKETSGERLKFVSEEELATKNIKRLQKRLDKLNRGELPDPKVKRIVTDEEKVLKQQIKEAELELGLIRERAPQKALSDAQKAEANIKRLRKQRERIEAGEEPIRFAKRTRVLTDAERTELRYLREAELIKLKGRLRYISQGFWSTTRDLNSEIFINGLLSNTKTGIINFTGNATAIMAAVFERSIAGLKNVDQSVDGVSISETAHMLRGYTTDSMFDLWTMFKKSMVEGPSDFAVKNDFIKPHSRVLVPETFGLNDNTTVLYKTIDFFGKAVNFPGKILMSTDEVFKAVNYRAQIHALAQRGALKKAKEQGFDVTMDGFSESVQRYRTDLLQNPTEDMLASAKGFAAKNTFTNKLPNQIIKDPETGEEIVRRGFTRNFQRMIDTDRTGLMRTFIPFFQTPVNLLFYASDRVPGLQKINQELAKELQSPDLATRHLAEAKTATGMTMLTTGMALASGGYITGSPPSDPTLRKRYHDAGWREHSVITEDGYRPFQRLDPLGILLSVSANMVTFGNSLVDLTGHAEDHGYTRELFDEYMSAFSDLALGTASLVTDRHYLQGFAMMTDLITTDPHEFERAFKKAGGNLAAGYLAPIGFYSSFRRAFQKGIDPSKRIKEQFPTVVEEGDDFLSVAQKKVVQVLSSYNDDFILSLPGWGAVDDSRYRPAKLDFIGEPTFYPGSQFNEDLHLTSSRVLNKTLTVGRSFINEFLNPLSETIKHKSPLVNKIAELNLGVEGLHVTESIKGVGLNNEERYFWEKTWGELNKRRVEPRINKEFNKLPQNRQADKLKMWLRSTKASAKRKTLRLFPRIKQTLRIDRINKREARQQNRMQDNPLFNLGQGQQ